jgi:hypothetical protein
VFEGLFGATAGKLILGMRVIQDDGSPCNFGSAFYRGLWRYIDALFFGLVAYTTMNAPQQKRLGDKRAHTMVVSRNEVGLINPHHWSRFLIALAVYLSVLAVWQLINLLRIVTFLEPANSFQAL